MIALCFITVCFSQDIKGNLITNNTLIPNSVIVTAFKSQKALLYHPPDVNHAEKVIENQKTASSVVEYEEITDSMIIQARQKHPPTRALRPILPAAILETPATLATSMSSGTQFTPTMCQQQGQRLEDTLMYAIPKTTENITTVILAMGDHTHNTAQQCVQPTTQCHDDSIQLTQNSAYQIMAKQHHHAERS